MSPCCLPLAAEVALSLDDPGTTLSPRAREIQALPGLESSSACDVDAILDEDEEEVEATAEADDEPCANALLAIMRGWKSCGACWVGTGAG